MNDKNGTKAKNKKQDLSYETMAKKGDAYYENVEQAEQKLENELKKKAKKDKA